MVIDFVKEINEEGIELLFHESKFADNTNLNIPLVSVIVICYQNSNLLANTIMSIINQNYPRIELLIIDDGSDFFLDDTWHYIVKSRRNKNLERLVIRKFTHNHGTVQNVRDGVSRIKGDYYITIGADDLLHDNSVIDSYMSVFNNNPDYWWVAGNMVVMTADYKKEMFKYPSEEDKSIMILENRQKIQGLFSRKGPMGAPGFCFKKGISELVGGYDLNYRLLEDWPLYMKLIRINILPKYMDKHVVKHGSTGVSKNLQPHTIPIRKQFVNDKIRLFENEIIPFYSELSKQDVKQSKKYHRDVNIKQLLFDCDYVVSSGKEKIKKIIHHPIILKWVICQHIERIHKKIKNIMKEWPSILLSFILSLLVLIQASNCNLDGIVKNILSVASITISLMSGLLLFVYGLFILNDWRKKK